MQRRLNPLHPIILRLEDKHFKRRAYKKLIATTSAVRDDLGLGRGFFQQREEIAG